MLADKYGFTVQVLEDANDISMLRAINDLNNAPARRQRAHLLRRSRHALAERANREQQLAARECRSAAEGYLLGAERIDHGHLGRLKAKRVLVVAGFLLRRSAVDRSELYVLRLQSRLRRRLVTYKLAKRSRMLLSSGGYQPVLDTGGGVHSVFARAFLDELESYQQVLSTSELFSRLQKRVQASAVTKSSVPKSRRIG